MGAPQTKFWDDLLSLNKRVDNLVGRVLAAKEPSQPITREIPFYGEVEILFQNLPLTFTATLNTGSDALAALNVKQGQFTNKGSRVYVREISMTGFRARTVTTGALVLNPRDERNPSDLTQQYPINWRWNFMTSIQQRWYSGVRNVRCLARSGGRQECGNHLSFREPLIIEPMETFTFEAELLAAGMSTTEITVGTNAIITMQLSGYREAM